MWRSALVPTLAHRVLAGATPAPGFTVPVADPHVAFGRPGAVSAAECGSPVLCGPCPATDHHVGPSHAAQDRILREESVGQFADPLCGALPGRGCRPGCDRIRGIPARSRRRTR